MSRRKTILVKLNSAKAMQSWGKQLATILKPGDAVALIGDLGSGKTTLAQGIASGWGYSGEVTSPTFSVVNEYASPKGPIYHMDMYRLTRKECAVFPLEEYFDQNALCLMEWADRVQSRWPRETIEIRLKSSGDDQREATLKRRNRG
jgi:tRNA threonylcarbamoyladenosine biosynthesis protein TsaE